MNLPPRRRIDNYANSRLPEVPHRFVPRRYGSPEACEICGGVQANKVHLDSREGRRRHGSS